MKSVASSSPERHTIARLYLGLELTQRFVAEELGRTHGHIRSHMKKPGIQARPYRKLV